MNRHDVAIAVRLAAIGDRTVTETAALRACADECELDRGYLYDLLANRGALICAACGRHANELDGHDPHDAMADLCNECYAEVNDTIYTDMQLARMDDSLRGRP